MGVITTWRRGRGARFGLATGAALLGAAACAPAPNSATPGPGTGVLVAGAPPPGACEVPARERPQETGCYLTADEPLGVLPEGPLFWHVHEFLSRPAAEAARGPRGTVVEAFGRVFLYTIGQEGWNPAGGLRIAAVGPLPHEAGTPYTARYMEGVFTGGMLTTAHRHSGAEAWVVLEGAQCLETPEGITLVRAGESAMVAAGPPMVLNHVGPHTRRSVLLVLHPSAEPWVTRGADWTPRGLCPRELAS